MERQLTSDHLLLDNNLYIQTYKQQISKDYSIINIKQHSADLLNYQRKSLISKANSNKINYKMNLNSSSQNDIFSSKKSLQIQFKEIKDDIARTQEQYKRRLTLIKNDSRSILRRFDIDKNKKSQ
jgi:hypothetical protein